MSIIKIKDKQFKVSIPEAEIKTRIKALAAQISKDMEGKNPLFLGVLNGSFIFAADLMREMTIPCEISFVKLASYQGTISTGKVQEVIALGTRRPASLHICTLFVKPTKLEEPLDIDYAAFSIPDDFILGYGLDYDQAGRYLKDVYTIVE